MNIREIKEISNYRNLSGKTVEFDSKLNFIIGENNIGKTNLLELINAVFSVGRFIEADFFDVQNPIQIVFSIEYDDLDIGFFEDNFDVDDIHSITVVAIQENVDGRISYYHDTPNQTPISYSTIRKINTLYYYAQRMPSKEIDFKKTNGSARILNYLIQNGLDKTGIEEKDILNRQRIEDVILEINKYVHSINAITGDKVNAYLDPVMSNVVSRILMLGDESGRELSHLGEGIQYAFNIILQIIEIIHETKLSRTAEEFEERLVCSEDKKYFPLLLLLDEPEIHQHPYRQRSLVKKLSELFDNSNSVFLWLLNELFGIDGLKGQIFIATHSPNILLNDYRQFIRFYKDVNSDELNIASGKSIVLEPKLHKHLLRNFLNLKEAMFSKKIIFVEGDTENGAIPVFASRMNYDLDVHGIGVIKLDGADGVINCMELYRKFGMKAYAILDRDKYASYAGKQDVFFTTEIDYEEDVFASFMLPDYLLCCKELETLQTMISPIKAQLPELDVRKFLNDPSQIQIAEAMASNIMTNCKEEQLSKLRNSKNALKGAILAEYVTQIPIAFSNLLDIVFSEE